MQKSSLTAQELQQSTPLLSKLSIKDLWQDIKLKNLMELWMISKMLSKFNPKIKILELTSNLSKKQNLLQTLKKLKLCKECLEEVCITKCLTHQNNLKTFLNCLNLDLKTPKLILTSKLALKVMQILKKVVLYSNFSTKKFQKLLRTSELFVQVRKMNRL